MDKEKGKYKTNLDIMDLENKDLLQKVRCELLNVYRLELKELKDMLKNPLVKVINSKWIQDKLNLKKAFRWASNEIFEQLTGITRRPIKKPSIKLINYFINTIDRITAFMQLNDSHCIKCTT